MRRRHFDTADFCDFESEKSALLQKHQKSTKRCDLRLSRLYAYSEFMRFERSIQQTIEYRWLIEHKSLRLLSLSDDWSTRSTILSMITLLRMNRLKRQLSTSRCWRLELRLTVWHLLDRLSAFVSIDANTTHWSENNISDWSDRNEFERFSFCIDSLDFRNDSEIQLSNIWWFLQATMTTTRSNCLIFSISVFWLIV